eukprot:TRINITY_DN36195_c0_g2_i1.p1 TRINITY_DN36195_c0_g2~~TRINITY_DN36195_c0_g2_i1.p1  ORF type:complete len:774 (-),score=168.51 TRINITY_DN36195_c0_g2_i1:463-2595(-)
MVDGEKTQQSRSLPPEVSAKQVLKHAAASETGLHATLPARGASPPAKHVAWETRQRKAVRFDACAGDAPLADSCEAASNLGTFPPNIFARFEEDLSRINVQVDELKSTAEAEIQSLRRGLAMVAEAVHAIRPVLDAELNHRADVESRLLTRLDKGLQDIRAEVGRLSAPLHILQAQLADLEPLRELRAERVRTELDALAPLREAGGQLIQLLSLELQARLEELEREAYDCRLRVATLTESTESWKQSQLVSRVERLEKAESLEAAAWSTSAGPKAVRDTVVGEVRLREALDFEADARRRSELRLEVALREVDARAAATLLDAQAVASEAAKASCAVRAHVTETEERLLAQNASMKLEVIEIEGGLSAQLASIKSQMNEALSARVEHLCSRIDGGLRAVDARFTEYDTSVCVKLDAAMDEIGVAAKAAATRTFQNLCAEVAAERQERLAMEEDLAARFRSSEQRAVAECRSQEKAFEQLSETMTHAFEATGTQLFRMQASERQQMAKDSAEIREDVQKALEAHVESKVKQAVAFVDTRAERRAEEWLRTQRWEDRAATTFFERRVESFAAEARRRCEETDRRHEEGLAASHQQLEMAIVEAERLRNVARVAATGSEQAVAEAVASLQAQVDGVKRRSEETQEELCAFADEQRVFCGFLDTEQRSYHELTRQELASLSRLVDRGLLSSPPRRGGAPKDFESELYGSFLAGSS